MTALANSTRGLLALLLMAALLLASCGVPNAGGSFVPPPEPAPSAAQPSAGEPPTAAAATPSSEPAPATTAPAPETPVPTAAPVQEETPVASEPAAPAETAVPAETAAPAETPAEPAPAFGSEILFLRQGDLIALDVSTRAERRVATDVRDFAATPDGAKIALVRVVNGSTDLWLVQRDGSGLTQLSVDGNDRIEATPSWAPDGLTVVYAAADTAEQYPLRWPDWGAWCAVSQIYALDLPAGTLRPLGAGCDPQFSPDGRRIAFAAQPTRPEFGLESYGPTTVNSVRLINRQGQNGWNFAQAAGPEAAGRSAGRLVYAPAWSPDGSQVLYHRFYGNQVEVDINVSELGGSFEGQGQPTLEGAGWLLPARFSPDGRSYLVTEHNFSDARGFGGYDAWSVSVVRMEGTRNVFLPSGELAMRGTLLGGEPLERAQRAAWSPDGSELVVQLPPGWRPGISDQEPLDPSGAERPGELWRWRPGADPQERLVGDVDFASPLAWLPPAPRLELAAGYRLAYPASWQLAPSTESEERTALAPDTLQLVSAAPYAPLSADELGSKTVAEMFPSLVQPGGDNGDPIAWPDGSVYREFRSVDARGQRVAGATRVAHAADGSTVALLYRTTPERWPLDRPFAQALLARSGPVG